MATGYSPRIVTDGLVLAFDAANVKSFRGESTTNVVADPLPTSGWSASQSGGSTLTVSFLSENFIPFMRFSNVTNVSDYPRVTNSVFANSATITGTFSTSFEARGTPGAQVRLRIYENGSTKITNTVTLTSDWVRYTFENQSTAFLLNQPYFNAVTTGATYDIRNIQIEAKPYATPFVNGTRGTTVATGGGWVDRSGNSNHGELVNGLTYDSSNLGSLVFDGVDDYVQTAVYTLSRSNSTVSSWINISDFSTGKSSTGRVFIRRSGQNFQQLVAFFDGGYSFEVSTNSNPHELAGRTTGNVLSSDISANSWFHFSLVFDSNVFYGYVNGILTGTAALSSDGFFDRIGDGSGFADNYPAYFKGKMSVFKLYNRALSASEVLQNYNATKGRYGL